MNEVSETYSQTTFAAIPNATFLPGLESGVTPCDKQDGQMIDLFGQEVAPANLSARPESVKASKTTVTFGPTGSDSFASATLQQYLESKLVPRLNRAGSTLFKQTLKHRTTPLGRRYLEHTASVLRTSASGSTGWRTPDTNERGGEQKNVPLNSLLGRVVWLADQKASWATPKVSTGAYQYAGGDHSKIVLNLEGQVRLTDSGQTPNGSGVKTKSTGQLNPYFSLWLQGLPTEWGFCAEQVIRSSRRKPKPSLKP
jgi:hypothetical protein